MPVRAFGTFNCKVMDFAVMLEKLSGTMQTYSVEDVRTRITASLDQLLMSWIGKEGRDMFNLQMDARKIAKGIEEELDMEMRSIGVGITGFTIESFNYPEEIKKMQEKAAAQSMVGDMNKYSQIAMANSMEKGNGGSGSANLARSDGRHADGHDDGSADVKQYQYGAGDESRRPGTSEVREQAGQRLSSVLTAERLPMEQTSVETADRSWFSLHNII